MFKQLVPSTSSDIPDIILHPEVKAHVASRITQFNPLVKNNTDNVLDLLTYSHRVIEEFGHMISINSPLEMASIVDELTPELESSAF